MTARIEISGEARTYLKSTQERTGDAADMERLSLLVPRTVCDTFNRSTESILPACTRAALTVDGHPLTHPCSFRFWVLSRPSLVRQQQKPSL